MKPYVILTWFLYAVCVWIGFEMVLHPDARYRLGGAALAALAAIFVVTMRGENNG